MNDVPYVSIVIVGRNDDYGDNFLQRIQTFVRSLDHQVKSHSKMFELVIVDWNPLPDKKPLSDMLPATNHLAIRVITVNNDLHKSFGSPNAVLEFHGKNVGIRRARGEFVLTTNPDILFTQQLIDELAKKKLRTDTLYRCDRYDFKIEGMENVSSEQLVDFALQNTFVVHTMQNRSSVSIPIEPGQQNLLVLPKSSIADNAWHTNGCGDFMLAAREAFYTVRGLYETIEYKWHLDSISLTRFRAAQFKQHLFATPLCIFHQDHHRKFQDVSIVSLDLLNLSEQRKSTGWGLADETLPEIELLPVTTAAYQ